MYKVYIKRKNISMNRKRKRYDYTEKYNKDEE